MADELERFWFRSSLFEVEPGEDKEINPGVYGRQLAQWLAAELQGCGYEPDVINEDWGRCIMCQRDPVWLWIGCANMHMTFPELPTEVPKTEEIIWHCFVECEVPFWKRLFVRTDLKPHKLKLAREVDRILRREPQIELLSEPS